MKALILAAGYATRLYPLTKEYPKPLLCVAGRPIIDYIVDKLSAVSGLDEIIVVTNSKFMPRFRGWLKKQRSPKKIRLVDDLTRSHKDKRGAIGDMFFVTESLRLREDLLVIGGDNLFDDGLEDFFLFARAKKPHPVMGIYDIGSRMSARHYGVLKLNREGRVADFQEKPAHPGSSLVAMCLYYFPAGKLGLIKEYVSGGKNGRDATGFYIDWLRQKEPVYGFVFRGRWYDIGDHGFYARAQKEFVK